MPFEHDHPRYGGRTAGTSNKPKPTLLEMLAQRYPNFHPILAMLEMYHDPETPVELRARLLNDIASYTVPRIKPIEFTEARRLTDETILTLAAGEQEPINTFIVAFLNGQLSGRDLASLIGALALKRQIQGQAGMNEQAALLSLIKG
jgi:hypothetical protein